jgi:mitochondrial chaperone BCS1
VLVKRVLSPGGYYGKMKETLQLRHANFSLLPVLFTQKFSLSILTRSHQILNEMLLEAKKQYMADQAHRISVYVSDS